MDGNLFTQWEDIYMFLVNTELELFLVITKIGQFSEYESVLNKN